jgi:competence protein CoiA
MQYALVSDVRLEAFPGGRGICELCRAATVSKCGPRVMHHWAHAARKGCDPWWENETEWHRAWKNRFPEECRERCYTAPDGEGHRADIVTPTGS